MRRLSTGSRDMIAEFFAAVKAGYIQDVKKLVRRGVDINTADAVSGLRMLQLSALPTFQRGPPYPLAVRGSLSIK